MIITMIIMIIICVLTEATKITVKIEFRQKVVEAPKKL